MFDRLNFPQPWLSLILFLTWQLLSDGISGASVVMGLILAWLIPQLTQGFWPERLVFIRFWRMPAYLLRMLLDIVTDYSFSADPQWPPTETGICVLSAGSAAPAGHFHPCQHHFPHPRHRQFRHQR